MTTTRELDAERTEMKVELDDVTRRRAAGEITAREAADERAHIRAHYGALRQFGRPLYADD